MDPGTSGFDDRAFDGSFSSEGLGRLRGLLDQKLRQFMGDYSDDTLVVSLFVTLAIWLLNAVSSMFCCCNCPFNDRLLLFVRGVLPTDY